MRTALDVIGLPEVPASARVDPARVQRYQSGYKARFDSRAGKAPQWEAGDTVRVRCRRTGKFNDAQPAKVEARTGPVSYRLQDGRRVHARDLASARPTSRVDPEVWFDASSIPSDSASPADTEPAEPATPNPEPLRPPVLSSDPATPLLESRPTPTLRSDSASPPVRRSERTIRAPRRYSPS